MEVRMFRNQIFLSILLSTFLGCASTQSGIGQSYSGNIEAGWNDPTPFVGNQSKKDGQEVLLISSYKKAIEIATEVAQNALPSAQVSTSEFYENVKVLNIDFWMGDVHSIISPKIFQELDTGRTGIIYEVSNQGVGFNASMTPSYVSEAFFKQLSGYVIEHNIAKARFVSYNTLMVKGKSDVIPAFIPVSYVGFKKYIDQKRNKNPFEGIWVDQDGKYTLGIISSEKDPRYAYVAFVIESDTKEWKPGDVKIKFNDLSEGNVAISKYYMRNKIDVGIMWKTASTALFSINAPNNLEFALVKAYPINRKTKVVSGSGTAWAVAANGVFITNNHVVEGASEIFIGFKEDNPYRARVLISDDRTDLAVLRVDNFNKSISPLPIKLTSESNGEPVCALGYPLINVLGDSPKITDGIISAQRGIENDVTCYQITVPIQPGNSGGPLLNSFGEVVGVTNAKLSDKASKNSDIENVNFAIKSMYIMPLLEQLNIEPISLDQQKTLSTKEIFNRYSKAVLPIWVK